MPRAYKDYCPPQYYNSTAYLTCTQKKHCTSRELLLSMLLTHRHKVAAPDHSIQHTPPAIVALPLSAVHAPRSERTAVHASLTRMRENFLHKCISTPPYLNLVNAEFLVLALFFPCCQGGEALYLAVAQILILLIVWAQQRSYCRFCCCWCCYYTTARAYAAQIFAVGVGVMLPKFSPLG